uniref:Uncharacterized protein n=1 Tax=Arundo donax TaxID=35708 RepID=A0A0A9DYE3_ARUDO
MQEKKSRCHQPLEKITNRKLLTPNSSDNEVIDGKQRLQKPEVAGEPNAVVENGVVAVVANDANLITQELAVANGC